jgi:hypothetical protein
VRVTPAGVCVLASEDKWTKAKALLEEVQAMLDENPTLMPKLRLEQIWGFLIYVTRTYPCMVPYLIGFHMTIDSWRQNRRADGWRFSMSELKCRARVMEDDGEDIHTSEYPEAPERVKAVPRLQWDIDALRTLIPQIRRCFRVCLRRFDPGGGKYLV